MFFFLNLPVYHQTQKASLRVAIVQRAETASMVKGLTGGYNPDKRIAVCVSADANEKEEEEGVLPGRI